MDKLLYTSVDQSKQLLKLGLDPELASFSYRWTYCYCQEGEPIEDWKFEPYKMFDECPDEQLPCWRMEDLLQLENIELIGDEKGWTCNVYSTEDEDDEIRPLYVRYTGQHEMNPLVKGVVWMLKHKVI